MSDVYLPEWKPWKVTVEELEKLREKDRAALEAFYFENLSIIERFAKRYYYSLEKRRHFYSIQDMLQDVFLHLERLNFDAPSHFVTNVKDIFSESCFGSRNNAISSVFRDKFFHSLSLDTSLRSDQSRSFGDCIPGGTNPLVILLEERERRRQDKIERDLEPLLRRIFTPRQYEKWTQGLMIDNLRAALRRHADELLQFLREHGTPEYKLRGRIPTAEEERAAFSEQRALRRWQEEHFDELSPREQYLVLERRRQREYRERKKLEKARASV